MSRLTPAFLLVSVTFLLLAYGNSSWSWVAGPLVALGLWALELKSREPAAPAAARTEARRAPAPVD